MNARMALAGMVPLLVAACSQPPTPIPEFVADEEYGVYRDLLLENEEMWNIPAGTETVVFSDHTFVRHDADDVRAILNGKDGVSEELVSNYLEAKSRSHPLEAKFGLSASSPTWGSTPPWTSVVTEELVANLVAANAEAYDLAPLCAMAQALSR